MLVGLIFPAPCGYHTRSRPRIIRAMDYGAVIKALRSQMDQIDRAIAQLESLNSPDGSTAGTVQFKSRRGRKSMSPEERKQVAERMKRYWAGRRKNR